MTSSSTCEDLAARIVANAVDGRASKDSLAALLVPSARHRFFDACAEIEKHYTVACGKCEPCLEGGCACEGGICLQPLLRAESDYRAACGREWAALFADLENRDPLWATSEIATWHRWAQTLVA